jgi:ATP-dependent Clp protease ATP-binding subunit ClpC
MEQFLGIAVMLALMFLVFRFISKRDVDLPTTSEPLASADPTTLHLKAEALSGFFHAAGKTSDVVANQDFQNLVGYMDNEGYSNADLLGYYNGENIVLACAALIALGNRQGDEDAISQVLEPINSLAFWTRDFALQCLDRRYDHETPLVASVFSKVDASWQEPGARTILKEFLRIRLERGEKPDLAAGIGEAPDNKLGFLIALLSEIDGGSDTLRQLQAWQGAWIDLEFLRSIGRVWSSADERPSDRALEHEALLKHVGTLNSALSRSPARSTLLVGESGTGKTAIVKVFGKQLQSRGWTIFEAGSTELLAGMVYQGQLEERLRSLVERLQGGRKVLWVIPDFANLTMTGRSQHSTTSALDFLMAYIESGEITVLGEIGPGAHQKLLQSKPRLRTAVETETVGPLSDEATLKLARNWAASLRQDDGPEPVSETTLQEAWNLSRQYLWDKAAPGCLLEFLSLTLQRILPEGPAHGRPIVLDDLVATLGQLTGLPVSILDERQGLELEGLQKLFGERVQGQTEAVSCLVERVAMIKAGVTDPSRPQGVFLFAGPTGTGKTEIAKTLAEFLFGSHERMIRLDMSEFQDPASMDRLLGDPTEPRGDSLVEKIRKQPFSVILLDEFEKADDKVWDLFLQVFDDGRLTDRYGRTANFRHAIIIMTSNLGSVIPSGTSLGFVEGSTRFSGANVEKAVAKSFRREFLNRIDRVVVFRPLSREVMRSILEYQLREVFKRRGLRSRTWSVEWDGSALEFLLTKGFTADMGARPLKRAIEQYLLTPLARTIVSHQFPEGDQFLFIRRGGNDQLDVKFIDPDAPEPQEAASTTEAAGKLELPAIILSPHGSAEELACLKTRHDQLAEYVSGGTFHENKTKALELTAVKGFWESPERFGLLGKVETMDRVETGFKTAGSMLERLKKISTGGMKERTRLPKQLVGRLAHQLYLLETACDDIKDGRPSEAYLLLETTVADAGGFGPRLSAMYQSWAERRGMQLDVLDTPKTEATHYRFLCAVSGYGAHTILKPETGLHVLEEPEGEGKHFHRCAVRVQVVPQPETPPAPGREKQVAMQAMATPSEGAPEIVRRYREQPSPLVRDSVRGYRTGRLDQVLGGDFDLIS